MAQEEVRIEAAPQVTLAGTLVMPDGVDKPPVVLLVAGSGRLDRDSNERRFKLNVMAVIAEQLAGVGIASLRYDKRGCGRSTGDYYSAGHADLVSDAEAATRFLLDNKRLAKKKVFILGHSEGSLIAPQVSARVKQVRGLILICPTSQDFAELLFVQAKHVNDQVHALPGIKGFIPRVLFKFFGNPIQQQQKVLTKLGTDHSDVFRVMGNKVNAKWLRELLLLDTKAVFRAIERPTLVLGGGKDVQCDPSDVLELRNLVPGPVASYVLPNMTHLLRDDAQPASILRYREVIKAPVSPALLDHITTWLNEQL